MAVIGYLFAVIAVSWHRLVINGRKNYKRMNIFKPQRHEVHFILMLAFLNFVLYISTLLGSVITSFFLAYGCSLDVVSFFRLKRSIILYVFRSHLR